MSESAPRDDGESLPFDVELERVPSWVQASSALVILVSVLVAARLVHMLVLLPFLFASSLGRRFSSSATRVELHDESLDIGDNEIARAEIVDVWVDASESQPRAVVAFARQALKLAVLHFQNAAQATRFGDALDAMLPEGHAVIVGHRPRPIDLLSSLRFVAIAAAFFATGSPYGLFALVFFALGAWPVVRSKQVVATERSFEVRGVLDTQIHSYADVEMIDVDAGVIGLKGGTEIRLPREALRDPTLASTEWLERARTRVLEDIRRRRAGSDA